MNNYKLETIINQKLNTHLFKDFSPNGLQVEGCNKIKKIITGVSICQELIDYAIKDSAQAIIVHHGLFWENESKTIKNIKKNRIKSLLCNNINLYSWHLPLDAHEELGNNRQIAKQLDIIICGKISDFVLWGKFNPAITVKNLLNKIKLKFHKNPIFFGRSKNHYLQSIAWCSGKGQKFIKHAHYLQLDAFLTGEVSEDTMYYSRENNINFFSAGHYATEIYGIKALGNWISKTYHLDVSFININNPI
ncbi:Nif3-like dinuclear metal center hexameric protein [Buchnera aphidicola]|uniref:Nif3-like dinuclear metal center hexameric protein n=1 Tax=Buchnera aphidicola TaxID=9 RepID=UPI0034640965